MEALSVINETPKTFLIKNDQEGSRQTWLTSPLYLKIQMSQEEISASLWSGIRFFYVGSK